MKLRVFIIIIFSTFLVNISFGQRQFITNQYIYDLFLMNPANAGSNPNCYIVNGFFQKQWFGTDLAPTTQLLSFQAPLGGNVGSGTYFYNDRNGFNKKLSLQQTFSSKVTLKENKRGFTTLSFGLSALVEQTSLDESEFSGGSSAVDPSITGGVESGTGFNLNAGFIFQMNKFKTGFSITNILPQNNKMYDNSVEEPDLSKDWHFFASKSFKIPDRELYVEPIAYYRFNSQNDRKLDLNLKMQMPTLSEDLSFWGIIAYRRTMDSDFGKDLGFAATGGIIYRSLSVGLEYQLGTTSARTHYGNAMQLVIGFRFCNNRNNQAVPCSEASNGLGDVSTKEKKQHKGVLKR